MRVIEPTVMEGEDRGGTSRLGVPPQRRTFGGGQRTAPPTGVSADHPLLLARKQQRSDLFADD